MATNKHATIRYHALDRCFSNIGRKFFIDDLIDYCNQAIYEYTGSTDGVKRRQIFDDIKFMESDQGWSVPLMRLKDGKKVFYRYSDKNFSIKNQMINEHEAKQLKETLLIFSRFKGMPQFEWTEELLVRMETEFNIKETTKPVVSFEQNLFLYGLSNITPLFNAIQNRRVLRIEYKSFKSDTISTFIIHPYHLKQYNNRWFLFGFNSEYNDISNLAIDRIMTIEEIGDKYIENTTVDFDEYFEDIVGVSLIEGTQAELITLSVDIDLFPYIESKPIHGSQKIKKKTKDYAIIELFLQINYELISLLFSHGERLKVIEPQSLRDSLKEKAEKVYKNYI